MRRYNDLGGLLFADWVSIYLTWLFLRFGIGPTPATVGMLIVGLSGAMLLPFGGVFAVIGGLLVVTFYVLDCVDGEVARYMGVEKYIWTFHDFFFGYFVKTAFYLGLSVHAFQMTGSVWAMVMGSSAILGMLFKVFLEQAPLFLTSGHVFQRTEKECQNICRELAPFRKDPSTADDSINATLKWRDALSSYGGGLGIIRSTVLNFHLSALGFVILAIADLWIPPFSMMGTVFDLKTLFIVFFGVALPLNFLDHLIHWIRNDKFHKESARLLSDIAARSDRSFRS